jgi:hypothetical protein
VLDILKAANPVYDFLGAINDPSKYILLDDTILHEIRISDSDEL